MTTRERAAEVLGLPPGATAAEAAAAFLAGLPAAGFVPAPARVAAVNALAGGAVPTDPDECDGPAAGVEALAREFWSVAPAARRAAWEALRAGAGDGPDSARLLDLRPGLDVESDPVPPGPAAGEVAALIRELFVLPPRERAVRRNGWLVANAGRHAELVAGAKELTLLRPDLVGLDTVLAARLSPAFDAAGFAAAAEALPLMEPVAPPRSVAPTWAPARGGPRPAPVQVRQAAGCGLPVYWVLMFVVLGAIRACVGGGSDRSAPPRTPIPSYEYRPYNPPPAIPKTIPGVRTVFTAAEVEEFRKYEADRLGPTPPGYAGWLLVGRPEGVPGGVPKDPATWIFRPEVVEECRRFERVGGPKPPLYDLWVRSGRPAPQQVPPQFKP